MTSPEPRRHFTHPEPNDDWETLAQRISRDASQSVDVATLQSWNLHLVQRPPTITITPLDIVFTEPPRPEPG